MASSETRRPESVMERGPLKAEIVTVRSCRAMRARASSSGNHNSEHRSFSASAGFHEARSERDYLGCLLERENSGDAGSGDFSHAMADDG